MKIAMRGHDHGRCIDRYPVTDPIEDPLLPHDFIASGASAELFDLGAGQVIKLFRDSVSEEMIAREADASIHAGMCGVPTAAAIGRRTWNERRGIVYLRLAGETLMEWIRRNPMRAGWALDRMGYIHATMHRAGGGALRPLKQVLATDIAYGPAPIALQQAAIAYKMHDADPRQGLGGGPGADRGGVRGRAAAEH